MFQCGSTVIKMFRIHYGKKQEGYILLYAFLDFIKHVHERFRTTYQLLKFTSFPLL